MRLLLATMGIALVLAAVPAKEDASAQLSLSCGPRTQITGTWVADDGGTYRIRRIGSVVWWVGESGDQGQSFTNIFRGEIDGDIIKGEWLDVRTANGFKGDTNRGELTLELDGTLKSLSSFRQVSSTGGFGANRWSFNCPPPSAGGGHVIE